MPLPNPKRTSGTCLTVLLLLALPAAQALAIQHDHAAPAPLDSSVSETQPRPAPDAAVAPVVTAFNLIAVDEPTDTIAPEPTSRAEPAREAVDLFGSLGSAVSTVDLDQQRGGSAAAALTPLSGILAAGSVSDNRAVDVATGSNAIREGAFSNASGLPLVIQNTGANVLIQSATIVNVQLR